MAPDLALDIEDVPALRAYLESAGHIAPGEPVRIVTLAGGVSNRTVLVERPQGERWVLKQALGKLRVPVDWFSSPERIGREAAGLRWIPRLTWPGATPALVFEDARHHLLAMTAVPEPHRNWKTMLLDGVIEADHVRQFAGLLGAIHANGYRMRDELGRIFEDRTFFETLRLEPYYRYTGTVVPEAAGFLDGLCEETLAVRISVVHGDFSPKNVLVHDGRLVLLDHEVMHFGDPAFDLGFSLAHFLSKAHHVARRRAAFGEAALAYWDAYSRGVAEVGIAERVEARAVRHTLACLLARVAGRSCLEYLAEEERARQRRVVLSLVKRMPAGIPDAIAGFLERL